MESSADQASVGLSTNPNARSALLAEGWVPSSISTRHPFRRYAARWTDTLVISIPGFMLMGGLFALAPVKFDNIELTGLLIIVTFAAVVIPLAEALLMSTIGTTPGKALFGIRVHTKDGGKLSYTTAFGRSFLVNCRGVGLGLPIVSLVALAFAYRDLRLSGTTAWDRGLDTESFAKEWNKQRNIIGVAIFITSFFILSLLG